MTKILKSDQIINGMINTKWYFLTKRPDIPPLPVWYKMKYSALRKENKKIYGTGIPWACFWYNNNTELYLHGDEYKTAIQNATKILYSKQKLNKHLLMLKQSCHDAKKAAAIFNRCHWESYDNVKIYNLYKTVVDKYVLLYIYGFITWCTLVLQNDAYKIVTDHKKELENITLTPDQALGILIVPDDTTIYQEKEEKLAKLSKKYRRTVAGYKSEKYLSDNHHQLNKEIKKFIKQYCWVGFNYVGPALDYKTVVKELLQAHDNTKQKTPTKKEIHKICKFNEREKHIFYALEMISYTKDLRNTTDDYIHYCFSIFYDEISKRTGLTKTDIQFLWDNELEKLLKSDNNISRPYIQKKRKFCAAFALLKSLKMKEYYIGHEASKKREFVFKNSNQILEKISQNIIKGTIASTGVVTGKVKIINNIKEVKKVKKGDILVTGMTSPKYMSAIYNSNAIITDDGGLTCHAAIIARELKKPCIIGTKTATRVLKDGDLVEVDANNGIVKIIQRK
ncbi:MAG: PEP-utilizing enzyme [Patescibacteria group bacterium]|nr:PEP-utilizing enzyme [Patescibacteria group bacterium]